MALNLWDDPDGMVSARRRTTELVPSTNAGRRGCFDLTTPEKRVPSAATSRRHVAAGAILLRLFVRWAAAEKERASVRVAAPRGSRELDQWNSVICEPGIATTNQEVAGSSPAGRDSLYRYAEGYRKLARVAVRNPRRMCPAVECVPSPSCSLRRRRDAAPRHRRTACRIASALRRHRHRIAVRWNSCRLAELKAALAERSEPFDAMWDWEYRKLTRALTSMKDTWARTSTGLMTI